MSDATRPMGARADDLGVPQVVRWLPDSNGHRAYESGPMPALPNGALVAGGRFRIVHDIRQGAGGTTYKAQDVGTGRLVALKVLEGKYEHRADAAPRLLAEARYATALGRHAHIVQPVAWGHLPEADGRPFMAMEFVAGSTLAAYAGASVSVAEKCRVLRDLAGVLAELHAIGIVHRDVKPDNVMLAETGGRVIAKLTDFGLAAMAAQVRVVGAAELTGAHDRPGTKHYMAPEQCMGFPVTPAFDVYALGVTSYELFAGMAPWGGNSPLEVVLRKCDATQPGFRLSRLALELPPGVSEVVDRALSFAPDERPTAAEFRDVMGAVGGAGRASAWARGIGIAGVGLVAIGAAAWWFGRPTIAAEVSRAAEVVMVREDVVAPRARPAAVEPVRVAPVVVHDAAPREPLPAASARVIATRPRKAKPRSGMSVPADDVVDCAAMHAAMAAAKAVRDWKAMLRHASVKGCWPASERQQIRVRALAALDRYAECVAEAGVSTDAVVVQWRGYCAKKQERE